MPAPARACGAGKAALEAKRGQVGGARGLGGRGGVSRGWYAARRGPQGEETFPFDCLRDRTPAAFRAPFLQDVAIGGRGEGTGDPSVLVFTTAGDSTMISEQRLRFSAGQGRGEMLTSFPTRSSLFSTMPHGAIPTAHSRPLDLEGWSFKASPTWLTTPVSSHKPHLRPFASALRSRRSRTQTRP